MTSTRKHLLLGSALFLAGGFHSAHAQNITNEAWIGQTGETNTITIIQAGVGNSAGANSSDLAVNQDGRFNAIVIDQYGWSNAVGAETLTQTGAPQGIDQVGDRNAIDVAQSNSASAGSNSIGAIFQSSLSGLFEVANALLVRQGATGGDGGADHRVGFVTQINDGDDAGTTLVEIFQSGGAAGEGNTVGQLVQSGSGNLMRVLQAQQGNLLGLGRQQGDDNEIIAQQGEGVDNTIDAVRQIGDLNRATVTQSGDRNYVADAYQNNEGIAISGNTLVATFAGNDNGGDGLGGAGAFGSAVATQVSVYQGAFTQIGDDNDIRFTVNGGSENLYGISQDGDGNGAIVAISRADSGSFPLAERNEVAIVQEGDDNNLSLDVVGDDNVLGAVMRGERNDVAFFQTGAGNTIALSIEGDDNNNTSLSGVGSFAGDVAALASGLALSPGRGLQSGDRNTADIGVTGDANLFAFRQGGGDNSVLLTVDGTANQSVIGQEGDFNAAMVKQTGAGNAMAVHQF